jgi:hypothetical protein
MPKAIAPAEPDLSALRRKITELIALHAVEMVQRAIDSVNEDGQYQAMKYLFEMIGLYPAPAGGEDELEETLAQRLLCRLGLLDQSERNASGETADRTQTIP